jgi:crotonobetainyl-CoA:carnitine CoA-transferase CaiB-like acyl-CoA transferase
MAYDDPGPTRGPGPLQGIRVLDLTRVLSGPHCTRMLLDLGAEVIKVEPPEGDMTRFSFPRIASIATYFTQQNVGKKNISLDMKRPEAAELLRKLADASDVVIENFRPGVAERMGLGYETLRARNPRLVYCSISGYGQTGPWVERRAFAPVVGAEAGVTWMQGMARGGAFANDPMSHGDVYTALEALAGVLAALFQRERTGRGQWVELSMAETLLSVNEHVHWEVSDADAEGEIASFAPGDYPVLALADGTEIVIAGHPAAKGVFERYCAAMGRPDLAADPDLATVAQRLGAMPRIHRALEDWARTFHDPEAAEAVLAKNNLAMGVLRSVREIADSDWAAARGAVVAVPDRAGGSVRVPNSPWHFSDADAGVRGRPAYRGEDNRSVLGDLLGLTTGELDDLERDGVLVSRVPTA